MANSKDKLRSVLENAPINRKFYFAEEAMVAMGVGKNKFYHLIRTGKLIGRKHGGRTIVLDQDIDAYLHNLPKMPASEDSEAA